MTTETTQMCTPETPTIKTGGSFNGNTLNISQSTPLENEVLSTDENSNITQGTTLKIEVSSNNENNISQSTALRTEVSSTDQHSNISQSTTITEFPSKKELNVKSSKHLMTYTYYLLPQNVFRKLSED